MKYFFFISLYTLLLLNSCKKTGEPQNTPPVCTAITSVKATAASLTVAKGDKFLYSAAPAFAGGPGGSISYTWTIPGEAARTTASDSVVSIDYRNAGWWYVAAKNTCDGVIKKDSFQLTVIPSCYNSVTNNILSFTGFLTGNAAFSGTKLQDGALDYNANEVYFGIQSDQPTVPGSSAFGAIVIVFHSQYKLANLPPSGIYTTSAIAANGHPVFGTGDFDKCFISYLAYNSSAGVVGYKSDPGQSIYISNQNGKLKAVLCTVALTGTSSLTGLTYHPVATGALAVP